MGPVAGGNDLTVRQDDGHLHHVILGGTVLDGFYPGGVVGDHPADGRVGPGVDREE